MLRAQQRLNKMYLRRYVIYTKVSQMSNKTSTGDKQLQQTLKH